MLNSSDPPIRHADLLGGRLHELLGRRRRDDGDVGDVRLAQDALEVADLLAHEHGDGGARATRAPSAPGAMQEALRLLNTNM